MDMKKQYALMMVAILCWIGCGTDNIVEIEIDAETEVEIPHHPLAAVGVANDATVNINCVELAYPFMMKIDGSITLVNNMDEFIAAQNDYTTGLDFEYPIVTTDEEVVTSPLDLADRYADCLPSKGWASGDLPYFDIDNTTSCLELTLPVTLQASTGSKTFDTHTDVIIALTESTYYFTFPLGLENADGQRGLIHNTDELFTALNACHSVSSPDLSNVDIYRPTACYDIVYPQAFVGADGAEHTVNDQDMYCAGSIKGDLVTWTYPFNLTDDASREIAVAHSVAWPGIKAACKSGLDGDYIYQLLRRSSDYDATSGCHKLIYPVTLRQQDGEVDYLYDANDVRAVVDAWTSTAPYHDCNYPFSIVHNADEVILSSYSDLLHYMVTCQ